MNIVNKLTLRHLKENKGRTIVTILGICVSVAMITAVFVSVASFMQFMGEQSLYVTGNQHEELFDVTKETADKLESDDRIACVSRSLGVESSARIDERKSDRTGVFSIYAGDENWLKNYVTCKYEGTLPQNENEVAVAREFIERNELTWKIGDTISVERGTRWYKDSEGDIISQDGAVNYFSDEEFTPSGFKEYKITAITDKNYPTTGGMIRGMSEEEKLGVTDVSVLLEEVNTKSLDTAKDIVKDYSIQNYRINTDFLETVFAIDENSFMATSLIPMALFILVIIMIASVSLIYNAFGMSLNERVRYLGMLSSVGATKRQKRASVYYEGLILGAIGIPVGIGAGIAGIAITLYAVGDKIASTGMINGIENISMKAVVPVWSVIGIVIVSAITIFISSFIPAKKASAVTPIEALKQSKEIKIKSKKLKTPKIVRAVFGYEGELAHKNLKRNGRKSRVITFSIALSVVMFLSVNYFCSMFVQANDMQQNIPYQVYTTVKYDESDELEKELDKIPEIEDYYSASSLVHYYGEKYGDERWMNAEGILTSTYSNLLKKGQTVYLNAVDDEDFNALCEDNGIDYKDFYTGGQKALVMNNVSHKSGGAKVFTDKLIGMNITNDDVDEDYQIKVAGLVDFNENNYLCNLNPKNQISAYIPESVAFRGKDSGVKTIAVETQESDKVTEKMGKIADEKDISNVYVVDVIESQESMNTIVFVIQVFSYGFIALITLITIANIINTVSTSIALRRKEFAMLKSVGTTPKGFNKMISLESLFYGLKALIFALPVSALVSFALNKMLGSDSIPFELDWLIYLAVTVAVFAIVGFSMLYSVSKLRDDSIVETLKEDIN